MINCDQAFDCMTDSGRASSPELAAHLASCPRCRQMSDALSPAVDLLSGPVPPWMRSEGVSTAAAPTVEGVAVAVQSARKLSARSRASRHPIRRHLLASLGGALVGGVAMAMLLPSSPAPAGIVPEVCTWKHRDAAATTDAQTLALSCVVCHLKQTR